jgi:hypothetical protein
VNTHTNLHHVRTHTIFVYRTALCSVVNPGNNTNENTRPSKQAHNHPRQPIRMYNMLEAARGVPRKRKHCHNNSMHAYTKGCSGCFIQSSQHQPSAAAAAHLPKPSITHCTGLRNLGTRYDEIVHTLQHHGRQARGLLHAVIAVTAGSQEKQCAVAVHSRKRRQPAAPQKAWKVLPCCCSLQTGAAPAPAAQKDLVTALPYCCVLCDHPTDAQHPAILPQQHPLASPLADSAHPSQTSS